MKIIEVFHENDVVINGNTTFDAVLYFERWEPLDPPTLPMTHAIVPVWTA